MEKSKQTEPQVLKKLGHLFGVEVKNNRLDIPEEFGRGYCIGFVFNEHIRMLILDYELKDTIDIKSSDLDIAAQTILFKFQNVFPEKETETRDIRQPFRTTPSVLVATRNLDPDLIVPIHTHTATINIEVDALYLNNMFDFPKLSPVLKSLLQNKQPLVFEQIMFPSLKTIVKEILSKSGDETFKIFFLRVKAEELICRLLMELDKRDEKHLYGLNIHDIQTMYKIKELILEHIEIPPVIKELADFGNMSPTKLKRLFKQIFGNSIFNYYQNFRMKKAAFLLNEEQMSVSEVGYKVGFTNLSHFSKVFNEHIGLKPKQFSKFHKSL
jgi:AraC-like DNA-binding protein